MSDASTQPRFKFPSPIDAFRQARRYILNNALRRQQRSLDLSSYGLTELPPEIGLLKNLETLYLSNNQLSTLPPELGSMESLQKLFLTSNKLVELPSEIGDLQNLTSLRVSRNKLSTLPSSIGYLQRLTNIVLDENNFEELPSEIGRLRNLLSLTANGNLIRKLPSEIGQIEALRFLFLNNNQIESLPATLGNLRFLAQLALSNNALSSLPETFANLSQLMTLLLAGNQFTEFPAVLTRLSDLVTLRFGNNSLRAIAASIGLLGHLRSLSLQGNLIQVVPPELGQLRYLRVLDLSDNKINDLPAELGDVRSLEEAAKKDREPITDGLHLEGNPLSTPYPDLIRGGQPSATTNVLAWLRGELDLTSIEDSHPVASHSPSPPPEPAPEAGPSFQISSGKLDLIDGPEASSDFDRSTLETLQRRLKRQVGSLQEATRKVSNQHPQLASIVDEYVTLVAPPVGEVDVVELWSSGNALMAAATSFERQDKAKTLTEPLEPEHLALLLEVSALHGAFILGFPRAVELTDRADRAQFDLDTIRAIGAPTSHVLSALSRQRRLLSERARHLIEALDAALLPGAWEIARIGYTSYATARNALVVIGRLVIWINDKGGSLVGGALIAAAVAESGLTQEALQQVVSFLQTNSSQITSFAAPFPELRTYMQWVIDFFDEQKKAAKEIDREDREPSDAARFDEKIERDAKTGRLDRLGDQAIDDFRKGRAREI